MYSEPDTSIPQNGYYNETLSYDLNGNITNLKRSEGLLTGSTTAMTIDDLSYSYTGNRLNSVTDLSGQYNGYSDTSGNTIPYDLNGNMTSHVDKGILGIDYNFLNLPSSLLFNAGLSTRTGILRNNTSYLYRAD
ncbi:RHS repeat-associated core domain-containing protein, partial [Chryseobacterium sp. RG1]|nr:RHS repeat-associated core domain-containing protein [Chryseobacterium tagetis]